MIILRSRRKVRGERLKGKRSILPFTLYFLPFTFYLGHVHSQDVNKLLADVKAKLDKVSDYKAAGRLKTDIAFIKVPIASVDIYFKKPDQLKIKKEGGISIIPKGGLSTNIGAILSVEHYTAVLAGETKLGNNTVKIVKLLPLDENSDVVLTTLYIDEPNLLIRKASTTTRDNGTFESELSYGKWSDWGLPDKVVFSFNTKNYKLPKGITFEYEGGEAPKPTEDMKNKKGKIEITYNSYIINKGLGEEGFK